MTHSPNLHPLGRSNYLQGKHWLHPLSACPWTISPLAYRAGTFFLKVDSTDRKLNSFDISQRINALLALEEKRMFDLDNIKRRQQIVKKYFNKSVKTIKFKVDEKVFLWDSTHADRGRHSKFQKLWLGPFKIAFVLGTNSYILKDLHERLFSYNTNNSHLKNYMEPT
jgi:hypothetical protein